MTDSSTTLANRANLIYANRPGFVRCSVEREQPSVLAFDFTTAEAAQNFMFEIKLQDRGLRMEIQDERPETVLQYR